MTTYTYFISYECITDSYTAKGKIYKKFFEKILTFPNQITSIKLSNLKESLKQEFIREDFFIQEYIKSEEDYPEEARYEIGVEVKILCISLLNKEIIK